MEWYEYWLIIYGFVLATGVIGTILSIGKKKEPTTGAVAAFTTIYGVISLIAIYNVLTA